MISSGCSGWRGIAGRLVLEVQWSGWAATGDNGVTHWLNALNHRVLWDYWPDGSVKVMTNAADKKWTYEYDVGGGCCGGGGAGNTTVAPIFRRQGLEECHRIMGDGGTDQVGVSGKAGTTQGQRHQFYGRVVGFASDIDLFTRFHLGNDLGELRLSFRNRDRHDFTLTTVTSGARSQGRVFSGMHWGRPFVHEAIPEAESYGVVCVVCVVRFAFCSRRPGARVRSSIFRWDPSGAAAAT